MKLGSHKLTKDRAMDEDFPDLIKEDLIRFLKIAKKGRFERNKTKFVIGWLMVCDDRYHADSNPLISDRNYDLLKELAYKYQPKHRYFTNVGAATPLSKSEKATLPVPMGSLVKIRPSELDAWIKKVKNKMPKRGKSSFLLYATPKFDGISLLLVYKNGEFYKAYTRHDGETGRDVTERVSPLAGKVFPQTLNGKIQSKKLYVRGELLMRTDTFEKYRQEFPEIDEKSAGGKARNRNVVGGLLNSQQMNKRIRVGLKRCTFLAHSAIAKNKGKGDYLESMNEGSKFDHLRKLGFNTVDSPPKCSFTAGVWTPWEYTPEVGKNFIYACKRDLPFLLDGVVVAFSDPATRKVLGFETNSFNPAYARSIKLDREDQESAWGRVKRVEWSYNKGGKYVPTVILKKPLDLGGANVQRALAHHYEFVKKQRIAPGVKIKVVRSGDVIPYIMEVKFHDAKKIKRPFNCYFCEEELKINGLHLICDNEKCEGLEYGRACNFFSALGVDGWGGSATQRMWNAGHKSIFKMCNVTAKDLVKIDGFAEKKAKSLIAARDAALKDIQLHHLMYASGYFISVTGGSLGNTKLEKIVDSLTPGIALKWDGEKKKLVKHLEKLEGIGTATAELFATGLPKFQRLYRSIKDKVRLVGTVKGPLTGKSFCFTGFRSKELEKRIIAAGGKVKGAVTKDLTVLFSAGASEKTAKAEANGTKVVAKAKVETYLERLGA